MCFKLFLPVTVLLSISVETILGEISTKTDLFIKVTRCHDTSLPYNVSYQLPVDEACSLMCLQKDGCKSYSVEKTTHTCYLYNKLFDDNGCEDGFNHFNSQKAIHVAAITCLNDGVYDNVSETCKCVNSYVGANCERLMQDCSEGFASGHYSGITGMFYIQPMMSHAPFRVRCKMMYDGSTFIMRQDPDFPYVNFTRKWEDYKNGFGHVEEDGNFYAGNDVIHLITTNRDHDLLFAISIDDNSVNNWRQCLYSYIKVASESEKYRLSYVKYRGNQGHELNDCFPGNNISFSTIDQDNDAATGSCSQQHLSGWWFDDCGPCNPTGEVQPNSETTQNADPTSLILPLPSPNNQAIRRITLYLTARP